MPQKGATVDRRPPSLGLGKKRLRCSMLKATRQNNCKERKVRETGEDAFGCVSVFARRRKRNVSSAASQGEKNPWNIVLTGRPRDASEYRG